MSQAAATAIPTCRFARPGEAEGPLCHCTRVGEASVRDAVGAGASTVEDIQRETGAGTGCGACHCRINRVLDGLPAACGGRFDLCHGCGSINAICSCEAA